MVDRTPSKRRRVMKEFVIRELSAVDRPAQGHARAVIMKRADDEAALDKRDFSQEARDRMAQSGEAMPDGSFPIPDEGALARAISSIGRAKNYDAARRHIIRRARALGALGSLPEEWNVSKSHFEVELEKAGGGNPNHDERGRFSSGSDGESGRVDAYRVVDINRTRDALREAGVSTSHIRTNRPLVEQRRMLSELADEHGIKPHYNKSSSDYPQAGGLQSVEDDIEAMDFDEVMAADHSREAAERVKDCVWSCWNALQRSFDTIAGDDSLAPADKVAAMQESLAQFLDAVRAQSATVADAIEKSISAAPALAELLDATGSEGGLPMTDAEKRQLAELQKSVADLTAQLAAATAKEPAKKAADLAGELEKAQEQIAEVTKKLEQSDAEKAEAIAKACMSDAEKAHCAGMDEKAKKTFMGMSPEDRRKAMAKAADADPVVYKSESSGEEFRKSDDPRLVKLAKQADESEKLAKSEARKREDAELAKRADDELKIFSEEVAKRDEKIAVLRAVDKMEEGPRAALLKMLSVGGKAISAAFDTIGHRQGDVTKSAQDFEKRVSEVQDRDKCSKLEALDKAAREFPQEFAAYQAGSAPRGN